MAGTRVTVRAGGPVGRKVYRAPVEWATRRLWPIGDPDLPVEPRLAPSAERTRPQFPVPHLPDLLRGR